MELVPKTSRWGADFLAAASRCSPDFGHAGSCARMVRRDDDEATRARIGVIGCNPQTVRDARDTDRRMIWLRTGLGWPERWGAADVFAEPSIH
jgi:hypothetical protein